MAMQLERYKEVIAFAEPKKRIEFLPYSYPLGYWDIVNQAARTEDLDAHLIAALIREESRFEPTVVSWAGAVGLMQLMPSTARRLKKGAGVYFKKNSELQNAEINIPLGAHYLSRLINEFRDIPLAIAAYNAGENILKDWMSRFDRADPIEFIENIPYKETRNYVKKVLKSYWQYRTINGLPVDASPLLCKAECGRTFSE
jgi:soluble lytic murein transglycosylase